MFGGGGFDGTHPERHRQRAGRTDRPAACRSAAATPPSPATPATRPTRSARRTARFGLNDEAVRNFGGDALKKTRDAAVFLIKARYAVDSIQKAYFAGGSTGGREAMAVDPALAGGLGRRHRLVSGLEPGRPRCSAATGSTARWRSRAPIPASRPSGELLLNAAHGGLRRPGRRGRRPHQQPAALQRRSSIRRRRRVNGEPLRCPGGADTGDTCLSDAQITALKTINTDDPASTSRWPAARTSYPGLQRLGRRSRHHHEPVAAASRPSPSWPSARRSRRCRCRGRRRTSACWSTSGSSTGITRSPGFNSLSLDPENPGPWAGRISELSTLLDQPVEPRRLRRARRQAAAGARHGRRAGEHPRDRGVLPAAAGQMGAGGGRQVRPLLRSARATATPSARSSTPPGIR